MQLRALVPEATRAVVIERCYSSKRWLFVKVDDTVYAGARFEDIGDTDHIHEFFLSVTLRLLSSIPSFT